MTLGQTCRQLANAPGFTAAVVLVLGIGIGATTAIFSMVDAVILRPLRFAGSERAVEVWTRAADGASAQPGVSGAVYRLVREGLGDVAAIEAYQFGSGTLTGGAEPVVVPAPSVTPGLLGLTGATPIAGRLFVDEDAGPGAAAVLISENLWASHFGRDPGVVGRRIAVDGAPRTVVGVLADTARYPESRAAVWTALDLAAVSQSRRRVQAVVVRRPHVSRDELHARLDAIVLSAKEAGALTATQSLVFDDLVQARVSRNQGQPLWVMLGAVGLVLLVACTNVMNLLLMRGATRRGELAVLSAIGASPIQLVRHSASEVVVLTALGGLAGLLTAKGLMRAILLLLPEQLYYLVSTPPALNWRVVALASALSGVVCFVAGLLPVWRASRVDALEALKWHARSLSGARDARWQALLIVTQIGVVTVLLSGSGLLLRSFTRLTAVDPGFVVEGLVSVAVDLTAPRYDDGAQGLATMRELQRRLEGDGFMNTALTAGRSVAFEIRPEREGGHPVSSEGMVLPWFRVSPGYFDTMGIPIVQGRGFVSADGADVMVVNDKLARTFWGEQSPVGGRFRLDADQPWRTVVGVVGDVRAMGLDDPTGHGMEFYTPHTATRAGGTYVLMIRSPLSVGAVIARAKAQLWAIDPGLPVTAAGTLRDELLDSLYRQRFVLRLFTSFAGVALALAGVGIYGVAAYQLARRRRDLAIRMALGATARHVIGLLTSRAAFVGVAGALLGAGGSMAGARWLDSWLYETGAADPVVVAATAGLMAMLILVACVVPVRSALSVDPAAVLRET